MQLDSKSNLPSRVPVTLLPLRIMRHMIPLIPSPGHSVSIGANFVADLWLLGMLPVGALLTSNVFPSPGVRVVAPKLISDRLRRNVPWKLIIPKGLISVTFAGKEAFLMAWTLVSTGWNPFSTRWPSVQVMASTLDTSCLSRKPVSEKCFNTVSRLLK